MLTLPTPYQERLQHQEPLARFTSARLGGPAEYLYIAREQDELAAVVPAAWAQGVPVRVLGGGANVLVSDAGVRGLVVVNKVERILSEEIADTSGHLTITSGMAMTHLARAAQSRGLSGLEWAISVPGTVGGAVVGNAGAHGGDMASCLQSIRLLELPNTFVQLPAEALGYAYRTSVLKQRADRRFLVLEAVLRLRRDDPAAIQSRMDANVAYRKKTQPPGASLGSIFKNPPGDYAGRLVESCGLKGYTLGSVQVSSVHANWIINTGQATASEYAALVRFVQTEVKRQTGVRLETEIEMIGEGF